MDVKQWSSEVFDLMQLLPSDTTAERIEANRQRLRKHRAYLKSFKGLTPSQKEMADELDSYYEYFDKGKKTPLSIDHIPERVKQRLEAVFAEEV